MLDSFNPAHLMQRVLRLSSSYSRDERRKIGYHEMRCHVGQYHQCPPATSYAGLHHRIRRLHRSHQQTPHPPAARERDCQSLVQSLVQPVSCPWIRDDEQRFRHRPSFQFSTLYQVVRTLMLAKRWRRDWFFLETKRQKCFLKLNRRRSGSLSCGLPIALWQRARE